MTRKWNTTKWNFNHAGNVHYSDVIMSAIASQITGILIVCLNVCSVADHRKHQSSMSLAFVRGIHRWQVNSPHKGPVTGKMFPFDDVIMEWKSSDEMGPRTLRHRVLFHHDSFDYWWDFMAIIFIVNYSFRLSVTKYIWFCKCTRPLMSLSILVSPRFATDCTCDFWHHGLSLASCLLVHFLEI